MFDICGNKMQVGDVFIFIAQIPGQDQRRLALGKLMEDTITTGRFHNPIVGNVEIWDAETFAKCAYRCRKKDYDKFREKLPEVWEYPYQHR